MARTFQRRVVLSLLAGVCGSGALLAQDVREISALRPGEFTWHPERSPSGPVAVVVSIPQQRVHVYRNSIRIGVSTCSTGKPGHETPRGVFVVLQKDKHHHSSTYNNAPMPNMNRLTWSGIALHAGDLPGYPASHGCVRLPMAFSEQLFEITHLGTPVIIANDHGDPFELTHPGLILGARAEESMEEAEAGLRGEASPDWSGDSQVGSVVASSSDRQILLILNGVVVASSALSIRGPGRLGSNVLTLATMADGEHGWIAISHDHGDWNPGETDDALLSRLEASSAFTAAMAAQMRPGLVLVTTDLPLSPDSISGKDFVIIT